MGARLIFSRCNQARSCLRLRSVVPPDVKKLLRPTHRNESAQVLRRFTQSRRQRRRSTDDQVEGSALIATEIDVLGITSWHQGVVIVWHGDVIPRDR